MTPKPLERICFDAAGLIADHPPKWRHPNKQAVFELACSSKHPFEGQIVYALWPEMQLPEAITRHNWFRARPGVFTYEQVPPAGAVEWHMNFADPLLFAAYGSSLLAQDELQVAEHPILGSLRDALIAMRKPAETVSHGSPTPVTISGVQRRCAIDTTPDLSAGRARSLYGNAFARAPLAEIIAATRVLAPPTISNILAMAAPAYGRGDYNRNQILYILRTAYSGFLAARLESERLNGSGSGTTIHTGFWGCGAFGGNRTLMTVLQAMAAELADVSVVFHAFDDARVALVENSYTLYTRLRDEDSAVAHLVEALVAQGCAWGESDGN